MSENNCAVKEVSLTQQASKGAFWGLSSNLTVSAISFIGTAILARLLSPKDFGLLGMAFLITGVVQLFGNLGLGAALIHKKNIDEEYLSTAFWSSLLVSVGLIIVSVILAPFASIFFNEPVVKWIVIVLSMNFMVSSFASVQRTLLYKNIRMKKIAFIETASRFIRVFIMLACALAGMGVWSIVIGMMAEGILKTILFVFTAHWRPTIQFNKLKFKELFHYGKNIYGQSFLNYLNQNIDFIVTGRLLGAQLLGFYQFAYNLPYLVKSYVQDGIIPVAFPVFSKVQDDDKRLAGGFLNAVKYISMITFPLMTGLAFCSEDFISVAYGTRWLPAAGPLKLLCFGAALASVNCIVFSLFNAKGRPDLGLKWNLFRLPATVILVIALSKYRLMGIAWAMFAIELITVTAAYIAARLLKIPFIRYLSIFLHVIYSSIVMVVCIYTLNAFALTSLSPYLRLPINGVLGCCAYSVSLYILSKKDFIEFCNFIKLCIKK